MLKLMLAASFFQEDSAPLISPWLMALIAILLVALFIWLLLRERGTTSREQGLTGRLAEARKAEARQNEAWSSTQRGATGQADKAQPMAPATAAPVDVFVPDVEIAPEPPAEAVRAEPMAQDDLEIIEGIGPKIAQVLRSAGVNTFAQLAELAPERVSEILSQGGIRLADPRSWAEQARLADAGDQAGLTALQNRLKGGRTVS
jgi:predicted flap endonuclease-1-like 5' DNA nuclease